MKNVPFLALLLLSSSVCQAGQTLDQANISYIQNDVSVADVKILNTGAGETKKTAATLNQTVTRDNAVITGDKSRVELKFNDGSVARLGQFSVFSFKEGTRDVQLKQGSVLLNVPKGMGQTNIKAAAVTAAITGTTVLFQAYENYAAIYVYEGSVSVPPNFVLGPGDALIFENGTYRVEKFDVKQAISTGALFTKFVESPNNAPFTLDEIFKQIPPSGPDQPGVDPRVDAVLNKIINTPPPKETYNNRD
ncbi:MAG: FecR family protein [Candidatus Methylacidiphilales bacterium]|nr:FecR family protein [Candidatus Methylacidiphilales bacterium]